MPICSIANAQLFTPFNGLLFEWPGRTVSNRKLVTSLDFTTFLRPRRNVDYIFDRRNVVYIKVSRGGGEKEREELRPSQRCWASRIEFLRSAQRRLLIDEEEEDKCTVKLQQGKSTQQTWKSQVQEFTPQQLQGKKGKNS